MNSEVKFGPTGQMIYERTYSRTKPDGSKETWPETVERVVDGNLSLVSDKHHLPNERETLIDLMTEFKILPAGRHLWASGVKGRQYLFNCHVSGWNPDDITDHFRFSFLRLMEGGGVGSNYSNQYLRDYPAVKNMLDVHIVCSKDHPDYDKLQSQGLISSEYSPEWEGAFPVEDSREGWADALVDLLRTYYRTDVKHSQRVYDVSRVRPEGARLATFGGRASGPAPLVVMLQTVSAVMNGAAGWRLSGLDAMDIDHAVAECVVSGGNRRSARMSIMRWSDPEIMDFIHCKSDPACHWSTNISVEVDDEFWKQIAMLRDEFPDGVEPGSFQSADVLNAIAKGMLTNGEPGFWDSSYSNQDEPNPVVATNPCGEIPLMEWENCNLGHVNLAAFVNQYGDLDSFGLMEAHSLMTRFLMRATYGDVADEKQAEVLAKNRRIGVGHFGFASAIAKMGIKYSKTPYNLIVIDMLRESKEVVDDTARLFAHDLRIPVPVKTTTVAPTGTVAKLPGVSEGIHPIFSKYFIRRIRLSSIDEDQRKTAIRYIRDGYHVEDCLYAPNTVVVSIPTMDSLMEDVSAIYGDSAEGIVESAGDLSLIEMLSVQEMYQSVWADNAVSYTANVDPSKYSIEDICEALRVFGGLLKGCTIFSEMSRPQSPYERISKEQYESSAIKNVEDSVDEDCTTGACPVR